MDGIKWYLGTFMQQHIHHEQNYFISDVGGICGCRGL